MASSENFPNLEPWTFLTPFSDAWISETFARDNEALTKALQKSLSYESETITTNSNSSLVHLIQPEQTPTPIPTPTVSGSDPETAPKRRSTICTATGKIAKRKSRATKRSPTTYIKADPANFRQMVQEVTGIRFGDSQVPVTPVLKPEPQRLGNRLQGYLPTLDTSAFLLNDINQRQQVFGTVTAPKDAHVSVSPVMDGGSGFDFDTFQSFPTLESWKVI